MLHMPKLRHLVHPDLVPTAGYSPIWSRCRLGYLQSTPTNQQSCLPSNCNRDRSAGWGGSAGNFWLPCGNWAEADADHHSPRYQFACAICDAPVQRLSQRLIAANRAGTADVSKFSPPWAVTVKRLL